MTERTFALLFMWIGLAAWIAWGAVFVVSWALHGHGVDFGMSLVSALAIAKLVVAIRAPLDEPSTPRYNSARNR